MSTEPRIETLDQVEQLREQFDADLDRQVLGVEGGSPIIDDLDEGPEIVVDGRRLSPAEIADLFDKPLEELTDAEREALQPLFDEAQEQAATHVQVDPLTLAGNLLVGAIEAVNSGNGNDRRLTQKIALGHALAVHAHAAATRMHAQVAQQQLQLMLEQRALLAGKQGGPASSIVVPTVAGIRR